MPPARTSAILTAIQPGERRFYLDDADRPIRSGAAWVERRGVRITHGAIGGLLLLLCGYGVASEGWGVEVLNGLLGLAFIAQALNTRLGSWLFRGSSERPFLALRDDGVTVRTREGERAYRWSDLAAVENQATRLRLLPRDGAPVSIAFSDLSYGRVQEVRRELLAAATAHDVDVR